MREPFNLVLLLVQIFDEEPFSERQSLPLESNWFNRAKLCIEGKQKPIRNTFVLEFWSFDTESIGSIVLPLAVLRIFARS